MVSEAQFGDIVRQRHADNTLFSADEIAGMSGDQYKTVLNDVAYMQRGSAEQAMLNIQHLTGGGVYSHAVEHVGDISHRMQEPFATQTGYSRDYVQPKAVRQHDALTHPYGFGKEHQENVEGTKRFRESRGESYPSDDERADLDRDYVLEHHRLPVYNEPAFHAKGAAVHLGLHNYDKAAEHLRTIADWSDEEYRHKMSQAGSVEWLKSQEPS